MPAKKLIFIWIAFLAAVPLFLHSDYYLTLIVQAAIYGILAVSLNIMVGFTGQISLATSAFWGIGAYVSALLTTRLGFNVWLAMIIAGLVSAAFGLLVGIPCLRVRGHYLAMITISFAEVTRLILMNYTSVTGGPIGISNIPHFAVGNMELRSPVQLYYVSILLVSIAVLLALRIRYSIGGRSFFAIRDDELVAEVIGIDTTAYKILAFSISAFFAGIAGSLYAHSYNYICPSIFVYSESAKVLCMVFIGGVGTVLGPVLGAVLLTLLPEWLRFLSQSYMAVYGAGLVIMVLLANSGLIGLLATTWLRFRRASSRLGLFVKKGMIN